MSDLDKTVESALSDIAEQCLERAKYSTPGNVNPTEEEIEEIKQLKEERRKERKRKQYDGSFLDWLVCPKCGSGNVENSGTGYYYNTFECQECDTRVDDSVC